MIYELADRKLDTRGDFFIAPGAAVIGSVVLGHDASIWFNVVVRGDNDLITIGERTNVQDGAVLHTDPGVPLSIGDGVTVGHMAMLHGCSIGDGCLIGIGSVVLNNVVVGKRCIVGARTLLPEGRQIPDESLVLGSPGRVVRSLEAREVAVLEELADHYVENAARYRRELCRRA